MENCCSLADNCRPFSSRMAAEMVPRGLTRGARLGGRRWTKFVIPYSRVSVWRTARRLAKPSAGLSAKDCHAIRVGRPPARGPSGAWFPSRIRKPFRTSGRSDNRARSRQCVAMRSGAGNLGEEATSRISRAHLIPVLPLVEPTGEKGFVLFAQQTLQRGQENVRWLGFRQKRVHCPQLALGQRFEGG